jgi:lipopolysaccharide biosynthesis glycosyltransferase
MDIVACTDNNYVMPTGVMMYSVCVNNQDSDITFHIVADESVTNKQKEQFQQTISLFANKQIIFYNVNQMHYEELPQRDDYPTITQATYYRLSLAEILPPSINKILYLDGDIVCRRPLEALWNTDISQHAVAGVHDVSTQLIEQKNHLHMETWSGYFNAGVLLINLKWWRDNKSSVFFYEFIHQHGDWLKYQDQDVLNYVFNEQKIILPIEDNLQEGFLWSNNNYTLMNEQEMMLAIHNPVIIHYTGGNKPWHRSCRHPYRSSFLKYKAQTLWKDEPQIEDRPLSVRTKKAIATILRKCKLIPELPPYGKGYLPGLKPLD